METHKVYGGGIEFNMFQLSPFFFLQFSKVLGAEHADNDSAGIKSFDYRFTSS